MQGRSRRVPLHEANALLSIIVYSLSKTSLAKRPLTMLVSVLFITCLRFLESSKILCSRLWQATTHFFIYCEIFYFFWNSSHTARKMRGRFSAQRFHHFHLASKR